MFYDRCSHTYTYYVHILLRTYYYVHIVLTHDDKSAGGRMLRSIDEWIQKSLDNLAESDEFARSDSLDTKGHKYLDLEGQHTKVEADGLTKRHTVAI